MSADLTASSDAVDIWLVFDEELADAALLDRYGSLLSPQEQAQEAALYFADDRRRYRITRALQRSALSRYAPVAPAEWTFVANEQGCPRIAASHGAAAQIAFNLSHTPGLIALAVTQGRAVGIDVENLSVRAVSTAMARRFFAPAEAAALASLAPEHWQRRFFEYWTFKESYIKARGLGLSLPLDKFSFCFAHERAVQLSVQAELGDDAARWSFAQYQPTPQHLLALCVERPGGADLPPRVNLRRVVPLAGEEDLALAPRRISL